MSGCSACVARIAAAVMLRRISLPASWSLPASRHHTWLSLSHPSTATSHSDSTTPGDTGGESSGILINIILINIILNFSIVFFRLVKILNFVNNFRIFSSNKTRKYEKNQHFTSHRLSTTSGETGERVQNVETIGKYKNVNLFFQFEKKFKSPANEFLLHWYYKTKRSAWIGYFDAYIMHNIAWGSDKQWHDSLSMCCIDKES